MTSVERFLEDYDFRKMFPEDLIPERTEWEDLVKIYSNEVSYYPCRQWVRTGWTG